MWRRLLGVWVALLALGCGSSSDSGGGGSGGSGSGISCEDSAPRMTATPSFEPASIPTGQSIGVVLTVPVTRTAHRVIANMYELAGTSGNAIGRNGQAYNDAAECSVAMTIDLSGDLPPGKYFPAITIEPKPSDGGGLDFVDYSFQSVISQTNYTLIVPPATVSDSKIAIPFLVVQ